MYQVVRYRRASTNRREGGGWSWGLRAWVWALGVARVAEARLSLLKTASTLASLAAFCCILPLLLLVYVWIKCWRACVGAWVVRAVEGVEGLVLGGHSHAHGRTPTHTHTLLLRLAGSPSLDHIRKSIKEEVVERVDSEGRLLHPNLRRRVEEVGGYQVWRRHSTFDVSQHVTQAPLHHRGRFVTHRNIQECVSEVVSQPMPPHLPPWHVTVITGGGCEGVATWVVARAHPTLTADLTLPDILTTAHPDPWRYPATRGLALLDAPAATRRLAHAILARARKAALWGGNVGAVWYRELREQLVAPARFLLEEASQGACKLTSKDLPPPAIMTATVVLTVMLVWARMWSTCVSLWASVKPQLRALCVWQWWLWCAMTVVRVWWRCVVWGLVAPWLLWEWTRLVLTSPEAAMVVEAGVEVYWLVRAVVSLPRLVLTEVINTWGMVPLTGWVGHRGSVSGQSGVAVAWSDPVPLSTARGVRGATGATLSEVLLTASAGAVRDYLRVTGLAVPDQVRCSLSVYSRRHAHNRSTTTPGFVTLPLPTGVSEATSALQQLRGAMESIRCYPERYLASMWLLRNVAYILPRPLLGPACRALAASCPVLLCNLAGPPQPEVLWGHDLLDILYWRPPHDGAVLSVCVSSYRGQAILGVAGNARVVPEPATLPQAFVKHLNELAVETGVRLERTCPRSCWFRNGSPISTPAHTPPPTPTFTHSSTPTFTSPPTPTFTSPPTPTFTSPPTPTFTSSPTPTFTSPPTPTFTSPPTPTFTSPPTLAYITKHARSISQCRRAGLMTSGPRRRQSAYLY